MEEHIPKRILAGREIVPSDFAISWDNAEACIFEEDALGPGIPGWSCYLNANCDVDEVLGTHVNTDDNDDYVNVYAMVSLEFDKLAPALTVVYWGEGESLSRPLTSREQHNILFMLQHYALDRLSGQLAATRALREDRGGA